MLYVHFAEAHLRPLPQSILSAQRGHDDPDKKVIAMLSARANCAQRSNNVAIKRVVAGLPARVRYRVATYMLPAAR